MKFRASKLLLQVCVALGVCVPIYGGLDGIIHSTDSHYQYLSGLLLGIGIAFASTIPNIERHTARFQLLTFIVVVGGLARLYGATQNGWPSPAMCFALAMELAVTPLLCIWQYAVAESEKNCHPSP
jgi:beta-phosphoglucomutase-like phosphatase (HAD superfamily)